MPRGLATLMMARPTAKAKVNTMPITASRLTRQLRST